MAASAVAASSSIFVPFKEVIWTSIIRYEHVISQLRRVIEVFGAHSTLSRAHVVASLGCWRGSVPSAPASMPQLQATLPRQHARDATTWYSYRLETRLEEKILDCLCNVSWFLEFRLYLCGSVSSVMAWKRAGGASSCHTCWQR